MKEKKYINAELLREKTKVSSLDIVVTGSADKPCFSIKYYDLSDKSWHIGFSSYDLNNVIKWEKEYLEVVENDRFEGMISKDKYILENTPSRSSSIGFEIYSEPKYKCEKCGGNVRKRLNMVYASNPLKYAYVCEKCGNVDYLNF